MDFWFSSQLPVPTLCLTRASVFCECPSRCWLYQLCCIDQPPIMQAKTNVTPLAAKIMMAIMVRPRSVDSGEGYWSGTKAASWNKSRANFALPRPFGRDLLALWGVLCISFVGKQFCFDGGSLALNTTFSSTTRETWRRLGMMSFLKETFTSASSSLSTGFTSLSFLAFDSLAGCVSVSR